MKRRDFIRKSTIAAIAAKTIILSSSQAAAMGLGNCEFSVVQKPDPLLLDPMNDLLPWLGSNGWLDVIRSITNLDLSGSLISSPVFTQEYPGKGNYPGCDDFVGKKLISPGMPQESLLYHLLASPRVRLAPGTPATSYASLEQIDLLENYIYSLREITPSMLNQPNMVLAVFAYEYRPACKTPHDYHADMVFSRTGFSRIGNQPISAYDRINRCFTNQPEDPSKEKDIAVTPARYGLFLAEKLPAWNLENNAIGVVGDRDRQFLLPIRKIYKNDPLINGWDLSFEESHHSERLKRLYTNPLVQRPANIAFRFNESPFSRRSNSSTNPAMVTGDYDQDLVDLSPVGSSVLLSSCPKPLAWRSFQNVAGKPERLRVKPLEKEGDYLYSNRRYSTLKLTGKGSQYRDSWNIILNHTIYRNTVTDYHAPRNEPMFVNIREIVDENSGAILRHLKEDMEHLLDETNKSNWVGLFEDNICDGCVTAKLTRSPNPTSDLGNRLLALPWLPAFSIVTAPDFFPLVESWDMKDFKHLFLSGGITDMSSGRLPANPNIQLPFRKEVAFPVDSRLAIENQVNDTTLAIVSAKRRLTGFNPGLERRTSEADSQTRTNFLPDSATLFFYPGWDVTYSGQDRKNGNRDLFYSTMGLGSPFMEDAKLCAAANGMWAAASPDAARTFWPTLSAVALNGLPPTAIPLLDRELGYHPESPAVTQYNEDHCFGWDGEQGPFLSRSAGGYQVNCTDINRSDYVQNALKNSFDMSQMRKITLSEIRQRLSCLENAYKKLKIKKNQVMLVGAEHLDASQPSVIVRSLPALLASKINISAQSAPFKNVPSYAFLFAEPKNKKIDVVQVKNTKRVTQEMENIYLCLVTPSKIKVCCFKQSGNWTPQWI